MTDFLETVAPAAAPPVIADPLPLLEEFLEWLRESSAESTVRTYGSALRDFIRRMAIKDLRTVDDDCSGLSARGASASSRDWSREMITGLESRQVAGFR